MRALIRVLSLLALLVIVLAGAVFMVARWEEQDFYAAGPAAAQTIIVVNQGAGLGRVADSLADGGTIRNGWWFRVGVIRRKQAAALKAGEYAFPAHASMAQILDMLVHHKVLQHRITMAEGLTSGMVMALLNTDPALTGTALLPPEGTLLPETYLYERGTTRAELLERMRKAQTKVVDALWPTRREGLPFATPQEALILASIVEKETGIASERPRIAAVFINRLRKGMRLESDPTIIYGLTKGVPLGHPLRASELATPNPYSTYQIAGMPPTPICNPGRDAIAAVLNPAESDEIFFVANGTGGHVFARTMAEHEHNVAQWRRIEQTQSRPTTEPPPARLR